MDAAEKALVRILVGTAGTYSGTGSGRSAAGAGWLISTRRCLTCAHVVNLALGRDPASPDRPGEEIRIALDLPNREATSDPDRPPRQATLINWFPPDPKAPPGQTEDIAVLELTAPVAGVAQPCLLPPDEAPPPGDPGLGFGFPRGSRRGVVASARLSAAAGGRRQIDATGKPEIEPGYSGGPFTDLDQRVIGMIAQRNRTHETASLIPAATLEQAVPELAGMRCGGSEPTVTLHLRTHKDELQIQMPDGERTKDLPLLHQAIAQQGYDALHMALFDGTEQRDAYLHPQPDPERPDAARKRLQLVCADAGAATLPWHCMEESPGRRPGGDDRGTHGWIIECLDRSTPGKRRLALVDTLIVSPAHPELATVAPSHTSQVAAHLRRLLVDPDAVPDRAHSLFDLATSLEREPDLIYLYAALDRDGALVLGHDRDDAQALPLATLFNDYLQHIDPEPVLWLHCIEGREAKLDLAALHGLTRDWPLLWLQRTTKRRAPDSHDRTYPNFVTFTEE